MDLRALSIKQPWPSLILAGVKRFECRTWEPKELGPLLLHASSGKANGITDLREESWYQASLQQAELTDEKAWVRSAFVGLIEIVEVISPNADLPSDFTDRDHDLCGNIDGHFLWRIGRRWEFPRPVPCHGKLNLWRPPAELHDALDAQLAAVGAPFTVTGGATRQPAAAPRSAPSRPKSKSSRPTKPAPSPDSDDALELQKKMYFEALHLKLPRGRKGKR